MATANGTSPRSTAVRSTWSTSAHIVFPRSGPPDGPPPLPFTPARAMSTAPRPDVDDGPGDALRLRRELVAEDLAEQIVDDGGQPLLGERRRGLFRLPHVDVAQPALGPLEGDVGDQALGRLVPEPGTDAGVEGSVDRDVLGEHVGHGGSPRPSPTSSECTSDGCTVGAVPRPVKRPYDNRTRELQSKATRDRILEAARTLLVAHGYRATTIAAIARAADVHVDTIYALVGRKPAVLQALIERAISGGAAAVAPQDRDYVKAMKAEPDPRAKLVIYAGAITRIQTRLAPLLLALRDAAATEPEARQVWDEINDRRAGNMRSLVRDLGPEGTLRRGVSVDEAADVIWLTASAETFIQLTVERGWSVGAYERWLVAAWPRLLLADG